MGNDEQTYAERYAAAQRVTAYRIAGMDYPRVRYGNETEDWGATHHDCHDCGVKRGDYHLPGCDVERCPRCGRQSISCNCDNDPFKPMRNTQGAAIDAAATRAQVDVATTLTELLRLMRTINALPMDEEGIHIWADAVLERAIIVLTADTPQKTLARELLDAYNEVNKWYA